MGSKITAIYEANNKRYGSPRIRAELSRIGIHTSKRRVERIMDQLNIHALQKKRHNSTTDSKHSLSVAPNLLNRNFTAAHPNEKWVADTIYTDDMRLDVLSCRSGSAFKKSYWLGHGKRKRKNW